MKCRQLARKSRNPGGRRRGDSDGRVLLKCKEKECSQKGVTFLTFDNDESYKAARELAVNGYGRCACWDCRVTDDIPLDDIRVFKCSYCEEIATPEEIHKMNKHDQEIRRGYNTAQWLHDLATNGVSGWSRNKGYQKCAIEKHLRKALFRGDGRPDNLSADIVTRYRFVAAISRASDAAERADIYNEYAYLLGCTVVGENAADAAAC
jgi:hypothetical protein